MIMLLTYKREMIGKNETQLSLIGWVFIYVKDSTYLKYLATVIIFK